jgi:methyl-accepting chemotaxis protein
MTFFKRQSLDLGAELIRQLVVPAFLLGRDGRVTHWNEACEKLTGLLASEVIGTSNHWRGFYREFRPCLADVVLGNGAGAVYASGGVDAAASGRGRAENWCDLPNGQRRYLLIDASLLRDDAGRTVGVLETLQDITVERAAREELAEREAERAQAAAEQQQVMDDLAHRLHVLAGGDLDVTIDKPYPDRYRRLSTDFNEAIAKLGAAMTEIKASSRTVAEAADEIASSSDALAKRAEHQAATLEETAAAHDEITTTVKQTLQISRNAAEMVATARERAAGSRDVVAQTVEAMQSIERSSGQIGQIIGVIDEIAFQTNLLALNAGVEAARAGEAGKGFAVVAQEVRALAQRSADAAREIKTLIGDATHAVSRGVELVHLTGSSLHEIADRVAEAADRVSEISASAGEQATSLEQVNHAITQLDSATQQNAHEADRAASACGGLTEEAARLAALVDRFRVAEPTAQGRRARAA